VSTRNSFKLDSSPSSVGKDPVSELANMYVPNRFFKDPSSVGSVPASRLASKRIHARLVRRPNSVGKIPVNWLWYK